MRIKLAIALLLIVGAIWGAHLLLDNRTLSAVQLEQAKIACQDCHTRPAFASASQVHARHPQIVCSTCHPQDPLVADFDVCKSCHGKPKYDSPLALHDTHAALSCSHCHGDNVGLKITDNLHDGLKWFDIGAVLFGLAGITTNFIIVSRRMKTK